MTILSRMLEGNTLVLEQSIFLSQIYHRVLPQNWSFTSDVPSVMMPILNDIIMLGIHFQLYQKCHYVTSSPLQWRWEFPTTSKAGGIGNSNFLSKFFNCLHAIKPRNISLKPIYSETISVLLVFPIAVQNILLDLSNCCP